MSGVQKKSYLCRAQILAVGTYFIKRYVYLSDRNSKGHYNKLNLFRLQLLDSIK